MQGNWTNKVAVTNFGQVLQGLAKMWFANTIIEHPNKSKLWVEIKKLFQEEFQAKSTNTETRNQLNKLRQEKDESVQTFSFRVQYIINSLFPVPQLSDNPSELQLGIAKVMKERNLLEMTVFFLSGLKADIRRACEAMPGFETFDWKDTVLAARKHEKILSGDEKSLSELKQKVAATSLTGDGEEDVDKQLASVELFKKELMAKKHGGNATGEEMGTEDSGTDETEDEAETQEGKSGESDVTDAKNGERTSRRNVRYPKINWASWRPMTRPRIQEPLIRSKNRKERRRETNKGYGKLQQPDPRTKNFYGGVDSFPL